MASTSETGHARNLANANLFNTFVVQLGTPIIPATDNYY